MKKTVGYTFLALLPWILCASLAIGQLPGGKPPRRPPVRPWDDDFDPTKRVKPPRGFDRDDRFDNMRPLPGPPPRVTVWECSKCKLELARGEEEPLHIRSCPRCGVKFRDKPGDDIRRVQNAVHHEVARVQAVAGFFERWGSTIGWSCGIATGEVVVGIFGIISLIVTTRMNKAAAKK